MSQNDAPEVPAGAVAEGDFQETPFGIARRIAWNANHDNVRAGGNPLSAEAPADTVRVIALQDVQGNVGAFGIEINVWGDFSETEASLIAAAINDAKRSIAQAETVLGAAKD